METLLPMNPLEVRFDYQSARAEGDAVVRRGLLDLAARMLDEEGPQALTLRALAQRANCSTKVVYTLFGGKNGLSEGLKVEGFAQLRFAVERERRRHRDPGRALLPIMMTYRTFALAHRALFRVMFGNALPEHVPTDYSRQQARLALGAVESAVADASAAQGGNRLDAREAAVRLWAAVHGPVSLELEGIPPFADHGERLARLGLTDALVALRLARPSDLAHTESTS
ncbi:MAG: TetR-like C-terminal domain-containing protein [Burkholderiales bacterium]|jgi:AcrR family transcriptional regulator|nr:TetR-like C-terminal domain-containing protein [Burkholderiales bacterium]